MYTQLNYNERMKIHILLSKNYSYSEISRELNRNKSTISREIKRNNDVWEGYDPEIAQCKTKQRTLHQHYFKFLDINDSAFSKAFKKKYDKRYFGIEATMNYIQKKYKNIKMVSIKTVFNWIKTNQWVIKKSDRLRQYYKKGRKRKASLSRLLGNNKYVFPIWTRPKFIDLNIQFGHWEADLVIGKRSNGYRNIVTLTERKSRFGLLGFVDSKDPHKVNKVLYELAIKANCPIYSITIDNGIEFEKIGLVAKRLDTIIFKAEPYASYQRGRNENFNGLVRRFWKKGTDFNSVSSEELNIAETMINNMPRKLLKWSTSAKVFTKENKKIKNNYYAQYVEKMTYFKENIIA